MSRETGGGCSCLWQDLPPPHFNIFSVIRTRDKVKVGDWLTCGMLVLDKHGSSRRSKDIGRGLLFR